ncbi:hypothetical protein ZWY2020_054522 [Hordeum vulgare]|nr:hypothetical protein ZWY2020_054522 [Hordeum vulgare]
MRTSTRLPPPLLSKEDWRSAQHRLRSSSSSSRLSRIGDGRRRQRQARQPARIDHPASAASPPSSRRTQISVMWIDRRQPQHSDFLDSSGMQYALHRDTGAMGGLQRESNEQTLADIRNNELSSHAYASSLGPSLSRSASPDPELFFEHGSTTQIKELSDQLIGRVLALSLQMYGCRVIQKAIEVVDLAQQTKMDIIQFIVSTFYGQVVLLSTHPYGCRVIQRVLEHCDDPTTQQIMMDEILQSVCLLAQDQYGNYVVQHVLEHGKPHERTAIIDKLIGQIVQMSQQKFASNVIESDDERPVANYVVQKVLETCDDQQREMILTRIKAHLNTLKKYTYGKHIVVA